MISMRILPSAASLGLILCLTGCFPVAMGLAGFGGGYMLKDQVAPSRSSPPPMSYDSDMPRSRSSYMPPSYGSPTTAPLYPANPYASARQGAPSPDTGGLYAIPAAPAGAGAPIMPAYPAQAQQAMPSQEMMPPQGMQAPGMPPQGIASQGMPPQGAAVPTGYVPAAYPPAGAYQPAPPMAPMAPYGNTRP